MVRDLAQAKGKQVEEMVPKIKEAEDKLWARLKADTWFMEQKVFSDFVYALMRTIRDMHETTTSSYCYSVVNNFPRPKPAKEEKE